MDRVSRDDLERWFAAGVAAVEARGATARALAAARPPERDPAIIATGKAAHGMCAAAVEWLALHGRTPADGVLVSDAPGPSPAPAIEALVGDHPVPGPRSEHAASVLGELAQRLDAGIPVLVFLSGGTSSLIAAPQPGGSMAAVTAAFGGLHRRGTAIHAMNRERSTLTRWGRGRLANALGDRDIRAWVMSDVVDDDLAAIGSGPLVPDDGIGRTIPHVVVANGSSAADGVALAAASDGVSVRIHAAPLVGDVVELAESLAAWLREACRGGAHPRPAQPWISPPAPAPRLHVFRGEPTVSLPEPHGVGGRAQQLALLLARAIDGSATPIRVLVGGTDGRDGPTDAAGAVIDAHTAATMRRHGINLEDALTRADAYPALEAIGALLRTGRTGTNVADLVLVALG